MNLTQAVQVGSAVANLLPVAAQLVNSVQQAMPEGTPGAAKLETVKNALEHIYAAEQKTVATFELVWPPISAIISGLVSAYQAVGLFKKSTPATPAA